MGIRRKLCVFALALSVALLPAARAHGADLPLGARTLSYGSWGGDVFRLQQQLVKAGYSVTVDGHYGSETRRAVTAFQLANGLEPDGVAGPRTIAALLLVDEMLTYTVRPGDSLWLIAQNFGTTVNELVNVNNLSPNRPIYPGQRLYVPVRPAYIVRPGDTLWEIARSFGVSVERLAQENRIADPSRIMVGQRLIIPRD